MTIYRHIADKAELEREYSPSSCVEDVGALVRAYAERSIAALPGLPGRRTHSYGEHADEMFDLYRPAGAEGPTPAMVWIHGGYWQETDKDDYVFAAPPLNRHGVTFIAVDYGNAPRTTLPQMVERCRRALAHIHANAAELGIDPERIHLSGCSAGGHLAAMTALVGEDRTPLASLALISGVFDIRPIPLTYINDAVGMTPDEALLFSPLLRLETSPGPFPRTLVVWAEHEPSEFGRQSRELAETLARRGAEVSLHEIRDRNHFDTVFDLGEETTPFGRLVHDLMGLKA